MTDFADVEQFAREHAACGGLTPSAQAPGADGGYRLTITCACGALHDRLVTAEEAGQPLPRPSGPPSPPPRASAPGPPASRVSTPLLPRVSVAAPPPPRLSAPAPAPPRLAAWPIPPSIPRPQRVEVTVQPPGHLSRGRAVWLILALVVVLGGAAAVYLAGVPLDLAGALYDLAGLLGERPAAAPAPTLPPPPAAAVVSPAARARAALDEIVASLRQLQASTTPSASLNDYASHVAGARLTIERLVGEAPEAARAPAREILEVYRLGGAAWRARTVDDRAEWERVGRDVAIDLCPAVKRAADAAGVPATASRARGVAVGGALLPLWECAAEKTAALDRTPAG